jgi:probable rRNA maturation factor
MPLRVILIANRHPRLRLDRRAVARVIHTLDANVSAFRLPPSAFPSGELSVVFLTDAALAKLHADFLGDPTPTDVITFSGDPAEGTAGEICISADAAQRQVSSSSFRPSPSAFRLSDSAFSAELTLYLVHGWLHLAGYDDLQPAKKRRMRRAETGALQLLRAAGAIPPFTLRH